MSKLSYVVGRSENQECYISKENSHLLLTKTMTLMLLEYIHDQRTSESGEKLSWSHEKKTAETLHGLRQIRNDTLRG